MKDKPKPLSPFMQAIVAGDKKEIERLLVAAKKPEPVKGAGFVLILEKRDATN